LLLDDREELIGEKMRTIAVGGRSPIENRFGLHSYSEKRATIRRIYLDIENARQNKRFVVSAELVRLAVRFTVLVRASGLI
jgi:hypothetical protein